MRPSWDLFWNWRLVAYRTQWLRFLQISREMQNVDVVYTRTKHTQTVRSSTTKRRHTVAYYELKARRYAERNETNIPQLFEYRERTENSMQLTANARLSEKENSRREHRRRARLEVSECEARGGEATITMQFMLRRSLDVCACKHHRREWGAPSPLPSGVTCRKLSAELHLCWKMMRNYIANWLLVCLCSQTKTLFARFLH